MSDEEDWNLTPEQVEELKRRIKEIDEGKAELIPADEVFRKCRQTIRRITYAKYDEAYFDGGPDSPGYNEYKDTWIWAPIVEIMIHYLGEPDGVLDWGCAKGFFVQRLAERGLNGNGVDVSEYAISKAVDWVRDHRLWVINSPRTVFASKSFDVISSFETLEHISEDDVPDTIAEFKRLCRRYFFGTIFLKGMECDDPTHICVKSRQWWDARFEDHGFQRKMSIVRAIANYPVFKKLGWEIFCYELKERS